MCVKRGYDEEAPDTLFALRGVLKGLSALGLLEQKLYQLSG